MKKCVAIILFFFVGVFVYAQEEKPDMDEIARKMSNPVIPLMNITTFYEYQAFTGDLPGAGDQSLHMFALQPPLPFPLKNGKSLTIRPLIPILFKQPFQSGANLGDISIDVLYGGMNKNGVLSGVGMIASLPTSTVDGADSNLGMGPSAMLGVMKKWGVFLVLLTQSWDISGDDKTAALGGQYAAAFSLSKGWQFVSSPPFSYNWDTKDLTLPIGGGPFRTVLMGKTPVKLGVQAYYYAVAPDALGPKWSIRLQIQPSVNRPW